MGWGPPAKTDSDGNGGQVLVYSNRVYAPFPQGTVDYYEYRLFYVNSSDRVYHWLIKRSPNPPDRLDVRMLLQVR